MSNIYEFFKSFNMLINNANYLNISLDHRIKDIHPKLVNSKTMTYSRTITDYISPAPTI